MATSDLTWMDSSLCREVDLDLFFPTAEHNNTREAKTICSRCRVKSECLSWGIDNPEIAGILGGTTLRERNMLRKRMQTVNA